MDYGKEDLVWPLEQYPSGHFGTHHDVCQYPIGTQDGKDIFCDRDAVQEVEGYLFCSLHAPMAARGCLDHEYSDGTTPREIIKAKFHSKEGIQELMREHANDSMPNCVLRECANVPHIRNVHDANGNWVLNINGCELYICSHRWGGGDNNNTTITIGNRRGQKDPVEPRFESQFDFIDGKLRYHYKIEDAEDL